MAARDSERYYWLKLHKDFFKRHDISIVEDMPNGKDYVLFYLKLMLESVDHEGALRFSDTIPYSETMLASVTRTNVDIVRSALKVFIELGMVEVFDDQTLFLRQVAELLDSETFQAKRKREMKHDLSQIGSGVNFTPPVVKNTKEIEKDIETESEREKEKEKEPEKEIDRETIGPEPQASPVLTIPLNDGSEYPITESYVEEMQKLYPAVDVMQEFREMRAWSLNNPNRRKTKRGVKSFINRWLSSEQDESAKKPQRRKVTTFMDV